MCQTLPYYNSRVDYYKHFFLSHSFTHPVTPSPTFDSFRRIDDVTLIFFSSHSRFVLLKFATKHTIPSKVINGFNLFACSGWRHFSSTKLFYLHVHGIHFFSSLSHRFFPPREQPPLAIVVVCSRNSTITIFKLVSASILMRKTQSCGNINNFQ